MDLQTAVKAYVSASRAYNADCNLRRMVKTDKDRRRLRAASDRAYKRMVRVITADSARGKPENIMRRLYRYLMGPRAYYHGLGECQLVYHGPRICCWILRAIDNAFPVTVALCVLAVWVMWFLTHVKL